MNLCAVAYLVLKDKLTSSVILVSMPSYHFEFYHLSQHHVKMHFDLIRFKNVSLVGLLQERIWIFSDVNTIYLILCNIINWAMKDIND